MVYSLIQTRRHCRSISSSSRTWTANKYAAKTSPSKQQQERADSTSGRDVFESKTQKFQSPRNGKDADDSHDGRPIRYGLSITRSDQDGFIHCFRPRRNQRKSLYPHRLADRRTSSQGTKVTRPAAISSDRRAMTSCRESSNAGSSGGCSEVISASTSSRRSASGRSSAEVRSDSSVWEDILTKLPY